ncbi:hypothetical protein Dred_1044 [Desulforamulus reducens MI-1]|uniref:Prepilin-type N-terminal cleavage/methylation domain-containing protein n=1 Tax=Desulforamulus reducens (strain ATCC BAA-1160 / DSM 100696 / MI-1) TaxID=349161 RepID=A4J3C6_DESRM|nr:type II secretion system protein [Desulforamulus reducens]ABO49579.1 hypothetical protein Dred_1044 [Desulforamulus reducens MI-1]
MKGLSQDKGFTLVELLVALAILAILIVAFTTFFGWNITSILETGKRSEAIANAEKKLEELYYKEDRELYFTNKTYLNDPTEGEYVEDPDNINSYDGRNRKFCVEPYVSGVVKGYTVTVVAFYQNGQRHVTISSFIEAD